MSADTYIEAAMIVVCLMNLCLMLYCVMLQIMWSEERKDLYTRIHARELKEYTNHETQKKQDVSKAVINEDEFLKKYVKV